MSPSPTSPSRPSPIWNASPQTVAEASMAISSASGQTSTGGPSQPPRANQPEIVSLNPLASQLQALVHWEVHQRTCIQWGGLYRSPASGNRGGERNMTTLAFVSGILLGGKAGVLLALYVHGMGGSALWASPLGVALPPFAW